MKFTRYNMLVRSAVSIRPAVLHTVCDCCDSTVWLELMYKVHSTNKNYSICRSCASDKQSAYELVNPRHATVQYVLMRNAERAVELASKRIELAQSGLKKIIQVMHDPSSDWNPERDKVIVEVTVEAENILRELDSGAKAVQPHSQPRKKSSKTRETISTNANKEQANV